MAERICGYDRSATPLGPILSWPQCLKTAVSSPKPASTAPGHGSRPPADPMGDRAEPRRPWLRLSWIEERPVCVAVRRDRHGYGQELIDQALPYSLSAETRYELDETGLRCTISIPLTKEGPKERGA
jgi:hypothetical protein